MILSAYTAALVAHQASRSGRRVPGARSNVLSKAETALQTILSSHRSCGVKCDETTVTSIAVTCTQHDPELHMNGFMWVAHEHNSFSDPIMCLTLQSEYDTIHSLGRESRPRAGRIATRRPARPRGDPSLEGLRGSRAARRCPCTCLLRQLVAATGASAPGHAAGHRRGPSREPGRLAAPGGSGLARDASAAHVSVRRRATPERCRGQPERRRH